MLLDDLHWADEETVAAFDYLADNVADEAILVVAASGLGRTETRLLRCVAWPTAGPRDSCRWAGWTSSTSWR